MRAGAYHGRVRVFSSSGEPAVVSVGTAPIGIFAIGQFARGIFVIGQFAIGVVVLGQFISSVFGLGQFGIGIGGFIGMGGIGGRGGLMLRLIPGLDHPREPPEATTLEALAASGATKGFVRAAIGPDGLLVGVHAKMTPDVAGALLLAARQGSPREVFAHVHGENGTFVADRLVEVPGTRSPFSFGVAALRFAGLVGVAVVWWWLLLDFAGPG